MTIFRRRRFMQEIIDLKANFCCGLICIAIIILQASPNDGLLQTNASQSGKYGYEISRNFNFKATKIFSMRRKIYFTIETFPIAEKLIT